MTKHLLVFPILFFFVTGCNRVAVSPTSTPLPPLTPTFELVTPTLTPYPSLQTQGPYLLFTRDNKKLTLMDADGNGRKEIQLPREGYITQLNRSISPDGDWLAYFTGSVEEPYDATLHLLNLSDETTLEISQLLAPGFPGNLDPILTTMVLGDPPIYDGDCFQDIECRRSMVKRELTGSIFSLGWAPDSRSIAFTAQIEGPSSDIYLYSLQDEVIRRLDNEPGTIYSLEWAPNGKSLLYKVNAAPGLGFEGSQWRLMDSNGEPIQISKELKTPEDRWDGDDWISDHQYLMLRFSDVEPSFAKFRVLDTDTGQVKEIWPDHADFYALNKRDQSIAIFHKNHKAQPSTIPDGIYIVSIDGKYRKISDLGAFYFLTQGQNPYPYFIEDYDKQIHAIGEDGSIQALPWSHIPWISPDGNLFLFRDGEGLALYDVSYRPLQSWTMSENIYNITWSPDSQSAFIFTNDNIYSLAVPAGQAQRLVEPCSPQNCDRPRFVWLP